MSKLLVIADDFTGALDTGVQFAKQGIPTFVTTDLSGDFTGREDAEVLVLDLESRHLPPAEAYGRVERVARAASESGIPHFYKKTDSTLRGNIGSELAALLAACGGGPLSFVPAFPKNGRITKGGVQYVSGVPLAETGFAKDPFNPVLHSAVAEIIAEQADIPVRCVPAEGYAASLQEPSAEAEVCVYDAETNADMARLGEELRAAGRLRLLAGCAGFAEILPALLGLRTSLIKWEGNRDSLLLVSGSVNQLAIDQMRRAQAEGIPMITLTPQQKFNRAFPGSPDCEALIGEVSRTLAREKKAAIRSIEERAQIGEADRYARQNGIPEEEQPELISRNMGCIVKTLFERTPPGTLAVFGGDTLFGIMEALGCSGIYPAAEISPGVVASMAVSKAGSFGIVTKAGGFGGEDVVQVIERFVFGN